MLSAFYINGIWQAPADLREIAVFNPATAEVLHRVAADGPRDVDRAVKAAHAALPGWSRAGGKASAQFLQAISGRLRGRAEDLAVLSSCNNAKPLAEARVDMADAAACFGYDAEKASELETRQDGSVLLPDPAYTSRLRLEPAGVTRRFLDWVMPQSSRSIDSRPRMT